MRVYLQNASIPVMNESFSRSQFPPNGWQFYQPSTGWSAPTPKASTFDQTVQLIIKHRLANPAQTARNNLAIDPVSVGNELENFTRARLGMPPMGVNAVDPKALAPRPLPQGVAAAVAAAGKMADGVALLLDWLPDGVAVQKSLSERRGGVCATCPQNSDKAFGSWFTEPVSARLKKMVEARIDLDLTTPYDDKLGVCGVCLCPMKLKVHVPLDFILAHTKPATMAEFPEHCWIKRRDQ